MRLLYSSDLHGNRKAYGALLERASRDDVDALVLGGDLCPRGGSTLGEWIAAQREFLESFLVPLFSPFKKKYPAKNIFAIMGNDDFRKNADVLEKAEKEGVLHFIHKKKAELGGGFFIAGYGFVNTTPFRLKDWEKKDLEGAKMPPQLSSETVRSVPEEKGTIAEDMEDIAALSDPRKTVYAIHAPPFNTNLDIASSGQHVGSVAIRDFIEKHSPLATLHGHIHESPEMSGSWMDVLGTTVCVNVGSAYPRPILPCCTIDTESITTLSYEEVPL
ncbi:TPA: hypothetical protein HA295_06085 [Candidatus Woesearchaeota archaeon]|nr:metallophosphoesterase [Candidatus Woesearchaeota archaeon]HII66311.1 hypothetical protein [Candidatus Woesearchaeota archaeon]